MLVARAGAAVGGAVEEAVPGEGPRASKHPILSPRGSLLAHACGISYSQKDSPAPPIPEGGSTASPGVPSHWALAFLLAGGGPVLGPTVLQEAWLPHRMELKLPGSF